LHEVAELGIKDEPAGLLVTDELVFNGEPDAARGCARRHDVSEKIGAMEAYIQECTVHSMASQSPASSDASSPVSSDASSRLT
jgi:hypothetical protein